MLCLSSGPVLIEAHAGTTPALVPAPTDAVPGAGLAAGSTAAVGAIAVPLCQIDAGTSATGYTFSALFTLMGYVSHECMLVGGANMFT